MFALRLVVFCLLLCRSYGFSTYWFNTFNNCNPPEKLVGKFCAAVLDNDVDGDGDVDRQDADFNLIKYDYDGDMCTIRKWEVVTELTCRYGWSEEYARFMFGRFDRNKDGVGNVSDFSGGFMFSNEDFLRLQYTRFKNDYCGVPANRENRIDRVLCAEVDALKPEDVKCD